MPGANPIYQHASDNVAPDATVAVNTGTEDPGYLAANIIDENPAKPAQLTTATGSWTFNYASPQRVDLMSIVMHNLDAGLEVRWQGHTSNVWTAPDVNLLVTIPTYREDGFPYNPWVDVAALVPTAANRTKAWWRLVVVGTNSANVKIGEVWIGATKRTLTRPIRPGATRTEERPGVIHETDFLVKLNYDYGVTRRSIQFTIENSDASHEEVMSWGRSCRWAMMPTLFIPNPDNNDAYLMKFVETEQGFEKVRKNYNVINLHLQEMSRGLVL